MISKLPTSRVLAPFVVVAGLLLSSCGSDGEPGAALTSDERGVEDAADERPTSSETSAYCEQAQELVDADIDIDEDPAAGLERLDSLQAVAPDELDGSFDVLSDVIEQLSGLDEDDPASLEKMLSIAFEPEVMAASEAISTYTSEECGIDIDAAAGGEDDTTTSLGGGSSDDVFGDDDPTGLDLEDVDRITDAAAGSWGDKLSGTLISGDIDVQVSAMDDQLLTVDEALAACTALMAGLGQKNPQVSVQVLSGETLLVEAPSGGACAQV